jgi:hypothetical protein
LDFVSDEQELSTQIERAAEIIISGNNDAFALNQLDDNLGEHRSPDLGALRPEGAQVVCGA